MKELFKPLDKDALMRKARERARSEAERRWPPDRRIERQREEDDLALLYYRQYMGAAP